LAKGRRFIAVGFKPHPDLRCGDSLLGEGEKEVIVGGIARQSVRIIGKKSSRDFGGDKREKKQEGKLTFLGQGNAYAVRIRH